MFHQDLWYIGYHNATQGYDIQSTLVTSDISHECWDLSMMLKWLELGFLCFPEYCTAKVGGVRILRSVFDWILSGCRDVPEPLEVYDVDYLSQSASFSVVLVVWRVRVGES